tara:strand:- start:4461 stop:5189 length:729 start_codon:yes stop_codon:yes gene_type:complete
MSSVNYDIYNGNTKNTTDQSVYDSFNDFIFSSDIKVLGKLLHRHDFFNKTRHLPGDIVEVGVFKGSGMATFSKILEIYCPNTIKKVVGFDIFDPDLSIDVLNKDTDIDKDSMNKVYSRIDSVDRTIESVHNRLTNVSSSNNFLLIGGDVEITLPKFIENNPGQRISLLYIDVDIERPSYIALKYLWDKVVPGGIIVFDEYEYHKFTESCGVDKFLKERNIEYNLITTNWLSPTCYIQKSKHL